MRLTKAQTEQIENDLQSSPKTFGYAQPQWTGNCLSRHLATNYQLVYGARHCRRLIRHAKDHVVSGTFAVHKLDVAIAKVETRPWSGFCDTYRQEKTLHRLRRLSTSALPLKFFAASVFEQLTLATNSGEAAQILFLGDISENRWITRDLETLEWTIAHPAEHERANSDDLNITGMLLPSRCLRNVMEPVLAPGQFMGPRFHESPSYDEFWKHHKIDSGVMNIVRSYGQVVGLAPVWKSRREKPFTQSDLNFLRKALPMIAHGIQVSRSLLQHLPLPDEAEPTNAPIGIVTTDLKGHVVAMDKTARALFFQPALFDGRPLDAFSSSNLRSGLQYVSAVVRQTFLNPGRDFGSFLAVPAARVWWHGTGSVFLLRAVLSERLARSPLVTILVEEREPSTVKQERLAVKYGMSPREGQIYHLANARTPRKEIARKLGLSANTVKTYLKQIAVKVNEFTDT